MNKIFKNFIPVAALTIILAMGGCVTKTDMETLQVERQQDLNRIKQLEAELEESKQQLKEEIEKSQSPVRERAADMHADIQSMRTEIAQLRGEIDMLSIRMDHQLGDSNSTMTMAELGERLDEIEFAMESQLQVDLPKVRKERSAALAAAAASQASDANATIAETTSTEPAPSTAGDDKTKTDPAKALYDKAYDLYKEGKYDQARSYWAEFTDTFKGHAFSASALFWQGQCYFKLKDWSRATILFEDVIEKYKKSSKYKSALLKAGYCWEYLGKKELAKMRFEEIIEKFPKSVEATQAKRSLEKMK